jgi:hypothetical protein
VRQFLERSPDYLKERGVIETSKNANLSRVCHTAVIVRDYLSYIPEQKGFWLTEFDALTWALQKSEKPIDAIHKFPRQERSSSIF